ncbi:hypothetical protein LTR94_022606, partial [Friedmanniomyces endolithicus]
MTRKSTGSQRHHINSQFKRLQGRAIAPDRLARCNQPIMLGGLQRQDGEIEPGAALDLHHGKGSPATGQQVDL